MYRIHRDIDTPNDATVVWHYFTLPKFLGLLDASALYFSRQDQFDDSAEGHLSQWDRKYLSQNEGSLADFLESDRVGCYFANCWTMSPSDEYVLWNTYASLVDGIAIKSSIGRLKNALPESDARSIYISGVNYYDDIKESTFKASGGIINRLALGFSKRSYFRAEKEVRLLFHDNDARLDDKSPRGLLFSVELNTLIEEIYVAPNSYQWFEKAVSHLMELYGLEKIPVRKSPI